MGRLGGRHAYNAAAMNLRTVVIAPLALVLVAPFVACGSSGAGVESDGGGAAPGAEIDPVQILTWKHFHGRRRGGRGLEEVP